jgi:hypothetical protein
MSFASLQSVSECGVTKREILENLVDSYSLLKLWSKAKSAILGKMTITEDQVDRKHEHYLWDIMRLAEILLDNKEYIEAHLLARRSLRRLRKLRGKGYEGCLVFLISCATRKRR